jgi:hypothetical protein
MKIEIREVKSHSDLKKFVNFPYGLYAGNKYWVPPLRLDEMNTLRTDKNPAFEFCDARYWLALQDGKICGRIAAIINRRFNEKCGMRFMRFGWVDFIDNYEVSASLFEVVEKWARDTDTTSLHGPLGFTDMDNEGMLIEGFEELGTLATIYNYPYYPNHLERLGFKKDIDWIEFEIEPPAQIPEKIERISEIALKRNNLKLLKIKKAKELLPYAHEIFQVINDAYQDLYGFVPLTDRQIDYYVKQYFSFINPEFVPVVLDETGRIAAFGITMPSVSKALQKSNGRLFPLGFWHLYKAMKKNDRADLYLTAVRRDMQNKGVNAILIRETNRIYIKHHITRAESNPELESNLKVQAQWRTMKHRQHKRRRCYIKNLT